MEPFDYCKSIGYIFIGLGLGQAMQGAQGTLKAHIHMSTLLTALHLFKEVDHMPT
jgi:hypothetical protein